VNHPEHGRITLGSTVVRYTLVRSPRRKKTIEVQVNGSGPVRISTPLDATRERVEQLLRARARWLIPRIRPDEPAWAHEFVDGETFLYLGRQARLRILDARAGEVPFVRLVRGRLEVRIRPAKRSSVKKRRVRLALEEWYRVRAEAKLGERVAFYASRLRVRPSGIAIRSQANRWGSCSKDGVLRFNWRIVMAPMTLVDYVVVHELSHLAGHQAHAEPFWRAVARVLPDYEVRREELRRRGREYTA
jgi:predicted metal-dependent hydrolase